MLIKVVPTGEPDRVRIDESPDVRVVKPENGSHIYGARATHSSFTALPHIL